MINKQLYPKTSRIRDSKIKISEKIDGSNLWIFRLNGELIFAQRNGIYTQSEVEAWASTYKWLQAFVKDNADKLDILEWSWVFWEWIGMWQINYSGRFDKKFYIFAKANIDSEYNIKNINYDNESFVYPFQSQVIPDCIWVVPSWEIEWEVTIELLNNMYSDYSNKVWKVEWFVINRNNSINKYVRFKNGKPSEHII